MADTDTDTAPAPARRKRRMIQTRVEEVRRLTPHMIRVVVGGDDLEGFGAGEFTDHYVKLQLPPPGAPYSAPFDAEDVKRALPARAVAAHAHLHRAGRGTPSAGA